MRDKDSPNLVSQKYRTETRFPYGRQQLRLVEQVHWARVVVVRECIQIRSAFQVPRREVMHRRMLGQLKQHLGIFGRVDELRRISDTGFAVECIEIKHGELPLLGVL